jgi:hypothetical protein
MEISEQEYKELKSHSQMLGVIGTYVEDFCKEDDTVLQGVLRLLADYYDMRSEEMYLAIDRNK